MQLAVFHVDGQLPIAWVEHTDHKKNVKRNFISENYYHCSLKCKLMQRSTYNMWRFSVINWIDTNTAAASYTAFIVTSAISIVIALGCAMRIV